MFLLFSIFGNIKTYLPFGQSPSVPQIRLASYLSGYIVQKQVIGYLLLSTTLTTVTVLITMILTLLLKII